MDVVIGTAGHIDHGKTSLVKALTGTDADRLPEEKKRGITIDIGFAEMDVGDLHVSFVDVPGHERFVKNMLAGASGIDIVMLVVAADEGVMPQTREHFNICRLLGIRTGIVAITKSDLAEDELLELVKLDVAELVQDSFLENAPVVPVSSVTGKGSEQLKDAIRNVAATLPPRDSDSISLLPVDRSFSVKGHGAVVTGTLISGSIGLDSSLELLPDRLPVRVRGVQSHGRSAERATAGRRVAVNLGGIEHSGISRGMVLAERDVLEPTQVVDASIEVVKDSPKPLQSRQRVRLHIGTAEILARVKVLNDTGEIIPGTTAFVQLRLEHPVVAVYGTRVILRTYSPQETIAGGTVLDPFPPRHRKKDRSHVLTMLNRIAAADLSKTELLLALIESSVETGVSPADLAARTAWTANFISANLDELKNRGRIVSAGNRVISTDSFDDVAEKIISAVKANHESEPLSKGISKEALREKVSRSADTAVFAAVLDSLVRNGAVTVTGDTVAGASGRPQLSLAETAARDLISADLAAAGLEVPKFSDLLAKAAAGSGLKPDHARKVLQTLIDAKEIVKVTDDFYFSRAAIDRLIRTLAEYAEKGDRAIDVSRFKDLAGVSRKYAIPLLEYFDREKVTLRTGDKRVIR
jgi:selenocysteine-specific elongation factor